MSFPHAHVLMTSFENELYEKELSYSREIKMGHTMQQIYSAA